MARYDNLYSKMVAQTKVFLPLLGLGLLATVFLFARQEPEAISLPYASVEIEALAKEQRLDNPSFATVTQDGSQLEITAERVRPERSDHDTMTSTELRGKLILPDSGYITLRANDGSIDGPSQIAELSGDVLIETTTGYTLATDRIATLLNITNIESPGPVVGTAPLGTLNAGAMEISQDLETGQYLLVFKQRVKLVYQP